MKNLFYPVLLILFISGCSNNQQKQMQNETFDFVQGDEINLSDLTDSLKANTNFIDLISKGENFSEHKSNSKEENISKVKSKIPKSRLDLEKMRTVVTLFNGSKNAGLTIPGFGGLNLGKDETNLNIYYVETKVASNNADSVVYGCGYSIHYLFKKVKKGLDISNLPSIAASVQLDSKKVKSIIANNRMVSSD